MELRMPYDIQAERVALSWVAAQQGDLATSMALLKPDMFFLKAHRLAFDAMAELHDADLSVSFISVRERLEAKGQLGEVGGLSGLAEMLLDPLAPLEGPSAVQILQRKWFFRRIAAVGEQLVTLGCTEGAPVDVVASEAVRAVVDAADLSWRQGDRSWSDVVDEAVDAIEQAGAAQGGLLGMASGFRSLDRLTHGWRPGQLIVIGARPSIGKTTFATHLARHALDAGEVVCFFSLEMTGADIVKKMLLADMRVSEEAVMDGGLDLDGARLRRMLGASAERLRALKGDVADAAEVTVQRIRSHAVQAFTELGKTGIIFIDYLQLIESGGVAGAARENRSVVVAQISRSLKKLAMDLQCPVVVMSQLNRASESRASRRPMMSDLRESGAIEQDADIVMLLDRSRNDDEAADADRPARGIFKVDLAKNRQGPTDVVELLIDDDNMCIYDAPDVWRGDAGPYAR